MMMEGSDLQNHLALGIMDLDDFKKVNDSFGHDRADDVLIKVAEIMKQGIEPSGIFARWGGEEFIFMLQGPTFEALIETVESLRMAIASEAIVIVGQTIQVTGSFGITEVLWDGGINLKR
ncbi:MAG: GGDEF domain-containing protein [Clostridia bacterium]|nr:GGDEF domain-containing protein [Clostridia bacterium]